MRYVTIHGDEFMELKESVFRDGLEELNRRGWFYAFSTPSRGTCTLIHRPELARLGPIGDRLSAALAKANPPSGVS